MSGGLAAVSGVETLVQKRKTQLKSTTVRK